MGGVEPARIHIVEALGDRKAGCHGKQGCALRSDGQEILTLAENNGCDIQFEGAAVAGAIPDHPGR